MSRHSQQRKLFIILALIVALPLMLLTWQGWKINNDNKQLNDVRFNNLVTARLDQIDTLIQSYFEELQLQWSLLIPQWQLDSASTRQRIDNNGSIRQIFIIDKNNKRRFPPTDEAITLAEQTFVDRLEPVWRDPQMLFANQSNRPLAEKQGAEQITANDAAASQGLSQELVDTEQQQASISSPAPAAKASPMESSPKNISKRKTITNTSAISRSPSTSRRGWYMWHWGSDSNLIFWQQAKDNSIVGVEMDPIRVKADLISRLPDTGESENENEFRLRLLDTAGHVVYQWGNFPTIADDTPQQKRSLSYPLSSWTLEYYGKSFTDAGLSRYTLLLTLLGFAALISGLAWFLYREQTREMRLAEQRVQFVSQVSHELKTPLTNIRMYAEMLEQQIDEAEQPRRYLQVITDESKRLTRLIANVLNFSRAPRIHKREIQPDEVIRQSINHFKPSFAAKQIELQAELHADKSILSDPDILEQILNNLLSNVEKYAASGKRVDIQSEIKNEQFVLRVRDYGEGIARSERKHIFKPFYRISDKLTEGVSGTGIGLTIARQQAQHLGGTLEYIDVKAGACFELTLPVGEST